MAKSNQGKQLPPEKIAEIGALQSLGQGGRQIAARTGLSRSTANKYQHELSELRDARKEHTIDRSFDILEMADQVVMEKLQQVNAYQAAVIGKIQTDRLLDLTNPARNANLTQVNIGGGSGLSFRQSKPGGDQE